MACDRVMAGADTAVRPYGIRRHMVARAGHGREGPMRGHAGVFAWGLTQERPELVKTRLSYFTKNVQNGGVAIIAE